MATVQAYSGRLNAAKSQRRRIETEEHMLLNRLALLRDEETRAMERARSLEEKCASADARHDERVFQKMMWSAARETGVHPLRAVGGAMSFPTRAELSVAGETLAALSSPLARHVLDSTRGGGRSGQHSPVSPLADALHATANAKGAALAVDSRVAPEHPVARAAWVAGRRASSARALLRSTASAAWARAADAGSLRATAGQNATQRSASQFDRFTKDRGTVLYTREGAKLAKDIGQINATARSQKATDVVDALVRGNNVAYSETDSRLPLLRAAEADLRARVAAASLRQQAAAEALQRSLTAPRLLLPFEESREARAMATLVVADAVGRGVVDSSLRPQGTIAPFSDSIPVNTLRASLNMSQVDSSFLPHAPSPTTLTAASRGARTLTLSPGIMYTDETANANALVPRSSISSSSSRGEMGGGAMPRLGPINFWTSPLSPLHSAPLDHQPTFRTTTGPANILLPASGMRSPLISTARAEALEHRLPNVAAALTGRTPLMYTGRTALELVETLFA